MSVKKRAPNNRTITLADTDREILRKRIADQSDLSPENYPILNGNYLDLLPYIPSQSIDLLFLDPPYNLTKSFNGRKFLQKSEKDYTVWLDEVISPMTRLLKPSASVYICGDWRTSHSIFEVASKYFKIQNRITWEREKGRGAKSNWKNSSEDIWFCTFSDDYYFNVDSVKLRRQVLAPYKVNGTPKDWQCTSKGNYRDTHPSNFWNDISIPFWSMPENTDHPTQKSEKLLAKLLLASTRCGDVVFDPFLGSGTTIVTSKKLNRYCIGIDIEEEYCLLALKRLDNACFDNTIQGYTDGIFWERNSISLQQKINPKSTKNMKIFSNDTAKLF